MSVLDTKEWFDIADEDLDISHILNNHHQKTHDIEKLLKLCIVIDNSFKMISKECKIINKFTNEIRYPCRMEVSEDEVNYIIKSAEKIKNLDVLQSIREQFSKN